MANGSAYDANLDGQRYRLRCWLMATRGGVTRELVGCYSTDGDLVGPGQTFVSYNPGYRYNEYARFNNLCFDKGQFRP